MADNVKMSTSEQKKVWDLGFEFSVSLENKGGRLMMSLYSGYCSENFIHIKNI